MTKTTYISIQHACSTARKFFWQAAITDTLKMRGLFDGITTMANFTSLLESLNLKNPLKSCQCVYGLQLVLFIK
jgi:hypothetical protein